MELVKVGCTCEWHYIDVDEQTWQKNIKKRNRQVLAGKGGSAFYIDAGLLEKMLSQWEVPNHEEINVWYTLKR